MRGDAVGEKHILVRGDAVGVEDNYHLIEHASSESAFVIRDQSPSMAVEHEK